VEQRQRRRSALVVRVRYEPSRVAAACLADAYEQVVPVVRRGVGRRGRPADSAGTEPPQWNRKGGTAG
jgi:hypothetical protein